MSDRIVNRKTKKNIITALVWVFGLVLLDQCTKLAATVYLQENGDFVLIPGVFVLRYLRNDSAAFSLDPITLLDKIFHFQIFAENPAVFLNAKMIFFVALTFLVIILLCLLYLRVPQTKRFRYMNWMLPALIAGAVGNCIDRMVNHYVVDFFYFSLIDFPIFNVADIYVTVSVFAAVLCVMFYYKEADFDEIFPPKPDKKKG